MKTLSIVAVVLLAAGIIPPTTAQVGGVQGLVWEKESMEATLKSGERYTHFSFWFTNTSSSEVAIHNARSSCFCTVARLPEQPWRIAPGASGPIQVSMDLAGKSGTVMKAVTVETSAGNKTLMVKTTIPTPATSAGNASMVDADRLKNMQTALADRQAVFKKAECASCHAEPAKGKTDGAELYAAVCHSCHDSPHRASSVPDLRALNHPTDAEHWRKWVTYGRAGSMMPAFAQAEGGPLDDRQINALVDYLAKAIPGRAAVAKPPGFSVEGGAVFPGGQKP
jgi:mono/diheme cytochrome c family protein